MGLDIYSGKLTRYYSRNWKTIVQQQAEERGIKCELVCFAGEIKPVEDKKEIDQIREIVVEWIDSIADGLPQIADMPLPRPLWDESTECDYYTDKPDWDAVGALKLLQACLSLNRPLPEYVENGWNAYKEPVVKEAVSKRIANSLLSNVDLWLPIPDKAIFVAIYPTGKEGSISTVALLKHELEEINRQLWNADEATILSWRNDKYYFPVNIKEPKPLFGFIPRRNKKSKKIFRTEDLAQCAYSILYQAVRFAEEHHTPILLDY